MIAISIPIHESMDCVVDLTENILNYAPNSYIIFHVSRAFSSFDESKLSPYKNVFINPDRSPTGVGLMKHHVSNFICLRSKVDFDYFVMMSSNEMLVKPGLCDYIEQNKNGFQSVFHHQRPNWHLFNRFQLPGNKWGDQAPYDFDFVKNPEYITWEIDCPDKCPDNIHGAKMAELMRDLGLKQIIGGQAEGQFYETEIFKEISDTYVRIWGLDEHVVGYETEECIPVMIAKTILKQRREKQTAPFTLVNYCQNTIVFNKELIDRVKQDDVDLGLNGGPTNPICLCPAHAPVSPWCPNHENWSRSKYVYSLKRVPRIYDDPIRTLIRSYYS